MAEFPMKPSLQGTIRGYGLLNATRDSWGYRHFSVWVWFSLLFLSFSSFTPSRLTKTGQTAEWLEELCFKKSHFKGQPLQFMTGLSEAISCLLMSWRSVLFSWVILFYPSLALHLLLKSQTLSSAVCNSAIWPLPFLHLQMTVSRSHQFTRPRLTWCAEHCSIILYWSYECSI